MARISTHPIAPIIETAERWKQNCLIGDGSLFLTASLWTPENINQFKHHFVDNLIYGSDQTFYEKFEIQMANSSIEVKQLAAEMLYILLLFPSKITARKKVEDIRLVWGWSGQNIDDIFPGLEASFAEGIGSTGMAYNNLRWAEFVFFTAWLISFKALTPSQRQDLVLNPWKFGNWLDGIEGSDKRQFRHIALFLLFPDYFETSSSKNQKNQMYSVFGGRVAYGNPLISAADSDWIKKDKTIYLAREQLTKESGKPVNFYLSPYKELWLATNDKNDDEGQDSSSEDLSKAPNRKIWAIGLGEGGRLWNESYEKGIISIGWDLGDLSSFKSQDEVMAKLVELRGSDFPNPTNDSLCCYQFAHEMNVGDLVIAKVGRKKILGGGIVTSDYVYDSDRREHKNIRQVKWVTNEEAELPGSGGPIKTLTEISRYPEFRELVEAYVSEKTVPEKIVADPYSYEDALKDLFLSEADLKSVIETAKRKKNIILQGPPGVGKTFVSKRLAYLLMGAKDPSRVEFVQFHQSYSYEDFVQGWRPNSDGGFNLKSGSFYEFSRKARSDLSRPYVFIIDEINRGNLSKIFGELLMLIESDKRGLENAIKLTYSESEADRFSVPENVFIIGLMNTADRSLAIVDYALRRRFAFFSLQPQLESSKFEDVITKAGGSVDLVKKIRARIGGLNQVIGNERRDLGPGFQIGHSYFCPVSPISTDAEWYLNVINTEIKPLIEEYWFDSPEKVDTLLAQLLD